MKTLAEASSKTDDVVFTPYLIPDASSLCSGLHIVKKLVKTEKFVFVVAKAGASMFLDPVSAIEHQSKPLHRNAMLVMK